MITEQSKGKKKKQEGGKRIPTCHVSSEYYYSKTYIFSWDICKRQRVSGEEWMYKTPLSTVSVSPLSGSSQMEMCLVCHRLITPGWSDKTDLHQTRCTYPAALTCEWQWSVAQGACCDPAAGCLELAGNGLEPSDSACTKPVITREEVCIFFKTCVSHRPAKDKPVLLTSDTQKLQWLW